jgi:hypothetical protein
MVALTNKCHVEYSALIRKVLLTIPRSTQTLVVYSCEVAAKDDVGEFLSEAAAVASTTATRVTLIENVGITSREEEGAGMGAAAAAVDERAVQNPGPKHRMRTLNGGRQGSDCVDLFYALCPTRDCNNRSERRLGDDRSSHFLLCKGCKRSERQAASVSLPAREGEVALPLVASRGASAAASLMPPPQSIETTAATTAGASGGSDTCGAEAGSGSSMLDRAFSHQLDMTSTIPRRCAGCGFTCYGPHGGVSGRFGARPRVCKGCRANGEALLFHPECNHMWWKHKMN